MKSIDLLAIICLLIEAVIAWWYFGYVWELIIIIIVVPFYSLIMTMLSTLIAVIVSVLTWSLKMSKILKLIKFLSFLIFRFLKIIMQKLGLKMLGEKTNWFPIFIGAVNAQKETIITNALESWTSLKQWRKIFYSISFAPIILIFLILSLAVSKIMRHFIYSSLKTSITDILIKSGLKKVSKDKK